MRLTIPVKDSVAGETKFLKGNVQDHTVARSRPKSLEVVLKLKNASVENALYGVVSISNTITVIETI